MSTSEVADRLLVKVLRGLNEAQSRWLVAREAVARGHGGLKAMHELTGMSRPTIIKGIRELQSEHDYIGAQRIRRPGAGRRPLESGDPGLRSALERILNEDTAGDPMTFLRWTHKSTREIAGELTRLGHPVSPDTVGRRLSKLDYSLQVNSKNLEGSSPPERDQQFRYINKLVEQALRRNEPVISVDAKKKERVGEFKNGGRTWRRRGCPREVNVYDFPSLAIGTATPYGAYDIGRNEGFVNVGVTHDTGEFAVESLRRWWQWFGRRHYPKARTWLVCADGGGSNGARCRSWKYHLQKLCDELSIAVTVCHYPPGTSKWNKIEHRMFSFISMNWRGQPLVTYQTIVNLIGATKTRTGLRVRARLDTGDYVLGVRIPDNEMKQLRLLPHSTHPTWNYTIKPR